MRISRVEEKEKKKFSTKKKIIIFFASRAYQNTFDTRELYIFIYSLSRTKKKVTYRQESIVLNFVKYNIGNEFYICKYL